MEEKEEEKENYITQVFGKPTWITIGYFKINVLDYTKYYTLLRIIDLLSKGQNEYKNLVDGMFIYKQPNIFGILERIKSNQLNN